MISGCPRGTPKGFRSQGDFQEKSGGGGQDAFGKPRGLPFPATLLEGAVGRRLWPPPSPLTQATGVAPTLRPEAPVSEADW